MSALEPCPRIAELEAENERLRDALIAIVTTWDGPSYKHFMRGNIDRARAALTPKETDE